VILTSVSPYDVGATPANPVGAACSAFATGVGVGVGVGGVRKSSMAC